MLQDLGLIVHRGISLIRKCPPPLGLTEDPRHMLRQGPRRVRFLMSEVPLCAITSSLRLVFFSPGWDP